jgi:secreted trypsin-like serine protease
VTTVAIIALVSVTAAGLLDDNVEIDEEAEEIIELLRRVRSAPRVKRIIGGSSYNLGQWTWLVALAGQIPATSFWGITTSYQNIYCGGSLVACNWVLTAAHCFAVPGAPAGITTAKNWNIMAGSTSRTVTGFVNTLKAFWASLFNVQTANWFNIPATKIISHPLYNANALWANDLALVKLSQCLPLAPTDPDISVVPLPTNVPPGWPPAGSNCCMQGWGCTAEGGPMQQYASTVVLPIVDSTDCQATLGITPGSNQICAGYDMQNMGICKGDSGGPLACLNGSTYVQAGIASFASANNSGAYPGGFTLVQPYLSWIQTTIANN